MISSGNVTLALGDGLGSMLGKKGTTSDMTLYNIKHGECALSFVEPSTYPDKIQSLVSAINISDQVLFEVGEISKKLAEQVVALDLSEMGRGYVLLGGDVPAEKFKAVVKGTVVEEYEVVEKQAVALRDALSSLELDSSRDTVVQVDHCFQVRGVGTVALGTVREGVVKKYDTLLSSVGDDKAYVKSVQVHDTDMESASKGMRVGLALKDVTPDDITRGTLLTNSPIESKDVLELDFVYSSFCPRKPSEGAKVIVNTCLNYTPAEVSSLETLEKNRYRMSIRLDKPIPMAGQPILILEPGSQMPRVWAKAL